MKNNGNRKIVLLGVLAVLVCIYVIQLVFTGRNKIKIVSVKDEPDSFVIQTGTGEEVKLFKDGDGWFVGDKKYPANASTAQEMCETVQSVKLLGTVSRSAAGEEERYGLDDGSRTVVTAFKDGKVIQSIIVGKDTSTGRQSFVQVSKDNSVYLAENALHSMFAVDVDALRSKEVYSLDSSEIYSVNISYKEDGVLKSFSFVKSADESSEEGFVSKENWICTPASMMSYSSEIPSEVDSEKVTNWVRSLSTLNVSEWLDDDFSISEADSDFSMLISAKDKTVDLRGYVKDDETYLYCSEVPYCFKVASYIGARFTKTPSDFSKDIDVD